MIRRTILVTAAILALGGAVSAQDAPTPEKTPGALKPIQPKRFPSNIAFTLKSFNGKPVSGDRPTIQFDTQMQFRGFGGCNTYSAIAYPSPRQGLAVGPIATTNKDCGKPIMDAEKAFLLAVRTLRVWDIKDNNLYVAGDNGELIFERSLF